MAHVSICASGELTLCAALEFRLDFTLYALGQDGLFLPVEGKCEEFMRGEMQVAGGA